MIKSHYMSETSNQLRQNDVYQKTATSNDEIRLRYVRILAGFALMSISNEPVFVEEIKEFLCQWDIEARTNGWAYFRRAQGLSHDEHGGSLPNRNWEETAPSPTSSWDDANITEYATKTTSNTVKEKPARGILTERINESQPRPTNAIDNFAEVSAEEAKERAVQREFKLVQDIEDSGHSSRKRRGSDLGASTTKRKKNESTGSDRIQSTATRMEMMPAKVATVGLRTAQARHQAPAVNESAEPSREEDDFAVRPEDVASSPEPEPFILTAAVVNCAVHEADDAASEEACADSQNDSLSGVSQSDGISSGFEASEDSDDDEEDVSSEDSFDVHLRNRRSVFEAQEQAALGTHEAPVIVDTDTSSNADDSDILNLRIKKQQEQGRSVRSLKLKVMMSRERRRGRRPFHELPIRELTVTMNHLRFIVTRSLQSRTKRAQNRSLDARKRKPRQERSPLRRQMEATVVRTKLQRLSAPRCQHRTSRKARLGSRNLCQEINAHSTPAQKTRRRRLKRRKSIGLLVVAENESESSHMMAYRLLLMPILYMLVLMDSGPGLFHAAMRPLLMIDAKQSWKLKSEQEGAAG